MHSSILIKFSPVGLVLTRLIPMNSAIFGRFKETAKSGNPKIGKRPPASDSKPTPTDKIPAKWLNARKGACRARRKRTLDPWLGSSNVRLWRIDLPTGVGRASGRLVDVRGSSFWPCRLWDAFGSYRGYQKLGWKPWAYIAWI